MLEPSIIPAIILQSLEHLRATLQSLNGVAPEVQIDIVDGVFVPDTSWPYKAGDRDAQIALLAESLPDGLSFELDLMIMDPLETLPLWLAQHPTRVVLHIEGFASDADIARAVAMARSGGSKAVLASLNDTPLERLLAFAPHIDGIQCMGIAEIGRQGNPFDTRVLERIRTIRGKHPTLPISVDGSVNKDTILRLRAAGANRFIIGSGIFNTDDPARAYRQLRRLMTAE